MATNVVMPQLGESVIEGTVGKWLKQVGDRVEQYEPILEVITDKVTTEIPAPASGTLLQILIGEGATVKAGTVLAVIGAPGEEVTSAAAPSPATTIAPARVGTTRLTPVVARMIAEHHITDAELATIRGTGEGGRITKKDLENFLKTRARPTQVPAWEQPGTGELFRPTEEVLQPAATPTRGAEEIIPLTPIRRTIAEHMLRSKQVAPHVTTVHEADMSRVLKFHQAHSAEFEKQGVKLTYTAYFVQAVVAALKAFPLVNASFTDEGIVVKREINIGIAVATDEGLMVPVIKNADEKSLLGLARAINDLASRAREKRLRPEEVQRGTFTLTNYGVFGSLFGTPIIHQPQAAILGVGAIQKRAVVIDDMLAIRPMVYLALTFDHRLLDGAQGDQFVQKIKQFLEEYPL